MDSQAKLLGAHETERALREQLESQRTDIQRLQNRTDELTSKLDASANSAAEDTRTLAHSEMQVQQLSEQLERSEAARNELHTSASSARSAVKRLQQKLQESIREIHRGNEIISQERADGETLRAQLAQVTTQQRQAAAAAATMREQRDEAVTSLASHNTRIAELESQLDAVHAELRQSSAKLQASVEQAQKQSAMIEWLNGELNTQQLRRFTYTRTPSSSQGRSGVGPLSTHSASSRPAAESAPATPPKLQVASTASPPPYGRLTATGSSLFGKR